MLKAIVSRRADVDGDIVEHEVVRRLNSSTTIEYFRYEPIEGVLPREFTSIVHWRLGDNNEIFVIETDVSWIPEKPQLFDCVRGRRLVQGEMARTCYNATVIEPKPCRTVRLEASPQRR